MVYIHKMLYKAPFVCAFTFILYSLFVLVIFLFSLSSYSKLFVASSYIVVFLLFSFLLWLSAFHTYNSSYSTSPNFWKSRIDFWWFVLISLLHFLLPYLVIFWPFNFNPIIFLFQSSLFDLADSFYFETLGGVVECESPNPTDRGFVLHIGNCCGLERKRVSSSRTVPIVYGPPNLQSNETLPSYSSLLLPAQSFLPIQLLLTYPTPLLLFLLGTSPLAISPSFVTLLLLSFLFLPSLSVLILFYEKATSTHLSLIMFLSREVLLILFFLL